MRKNNDAHICCKEKKHQDHINKTRKWLASNEGVQTLSASIQRFPFDHLKNVSKVDIVISSLENSSDSLMLFHHQDSKLKMLLTLWVFMVNLFKLFTSMKCVSFLTLLKWSIGLILMVRQIFRLWVHYGPFYDELFPDYWIGS